jgi:hypothetical protein
MVQVPFITENNKLGIIDYFLITFLPQIVVYTMNEGIIFIYKVTVNNYLIYPDN